MDTKAKKILNSLSPNKIIIPIVIGLGVVFYLLISSDDIDLNLIVSNIQNANLLWVFLAILVLLIRDVGYMYRIRYLTDKSLDWYASFFVIILWEFASAITPSVVGGTAIVVFIINKEGVPFGKSMAYVMLTAVLDNLFFVMASITVLLVAPFGIFPDISETLQTENFRFSLRTAFIVSVSLIASYTFVMIFGLFIKPKGLKWLLIKLTTIRFLKRWHNSAIQTGDDIILASQVLKEKTGIYWVRAVLSTIFIWSARYLMLNCLLAAFTHVNFLDHLLIFSRQIIMWIVMLVSPTPGSTGTAEVSFDLFFGEFFSVAGLTLVVALFWRLFTYYAYLLLGISVLPKWIQRVFGK